MKLQSAKAKKRRPAESPQGPNIAHANTTIASPTTIGSNEKAESVTIGAKNSPTNATATANK